MEGLGIRGGKGRRGFEEKVGKGGNWHLHQWKRRGPRDIPWFKHGGNGGRYGRVPIGDKVAVSEA